VNRAGYRERISRANGLLKFYCEEIDSRLLGSQRIATNLTIISPVNGLIGESRMRPHYFSIPDHLIWINEMSATHLLVTFWRQTGNDDFSDVVYQECPVTMLHGEDIGPRGRSFACRRLKCGPLPLSVFKPSTDVTAVLSASIGITVFDAWSIHNATGRCRTRQPLPSDRSQPRAPATIGD
jgi:hypothetical protein